MVVFPEGRALIAYSLRHIPGMCSTAVLRLVVPTGQTGLDDRKLPVLILAQDRRTAPLRTLEHPTDQKL